MTKAMKLIHLAALAACASPACAQELVDAPAPAEMRLDPVGFPPRAYTGRTVQTVYDNLSNVFGNGTGGIFLGTCENVIDDCHFAPGPWASATDRVITEITYGIKIGDPCNINDQVSIIFWDIDVLTFQGSSGAGTSMISPGATPLATITVDMPADCQFIWHFTTSLTGLPGGGVHVPDADAGVAVELAWVRHGCVPPAYTDLSGCLSSGCASQSNKGIAFGSNSLEPAASATDPGTASPATVGSTIPSYGRDISNATMCPNIGWFVGNGGAPVNTGNVEHRFIVVTPSSGVPTTYGMQVLLRGTGTLQPPPNATPLGCIPDAGFTQAGGVATGSVQWYTLCLSADATDQALHFVDLDTQGSPAPVGVGLYNSAGHLLGVDAGAGAVAQLSFGVGRRPGIGSGLQFDGHNGQLAAGTYYLAVAPSGSQFVDSWFSVTPAQGGGAFQLNLRTNVNGAPLAPSTPPLINGVDYGILDPDSGSQVMGIRQNTGVRGVLWSRFALARTVDSRRFLDIDFFSRSDFSSYAKRAYIFDSAGNLAYFIEVPSFAPRFSLGAPGPRYYNGGEPFDGNTPAGGNAGLPAGTYYLAACLSPADDLRALATGHRWHVRPESDLSDGLGADLYTGLAAAQCCLRDFNGDGDVGTDADIEAFFACLAGNCCPTCPPNADFNCDGDSGTDADIEAFFRVLAGGSC